MVSIRRAAGDSPPKTRVFRIGEKTVDTGVRYVGKPDHVEHETDRKFPG